MRMDSIGRFTRAPSRALVIGAIALIAATGCETGGDSLAPAIGLSDASEAKTLIASAADFDLNDLAAPPPGLSKPLPDWVANPDRLPPGLNGRNNCTYPLANSAIWNYHADGACWETPGPDGWTRQQQHHIYVPHLPICSNRPADVEPIRICRRPGEVSPCSNNPMTGPNGCAVCVPRYTCY
jgi:hypothetical protein